MLRTLLRDLRDRYNGHVRIELRPSTSPEQRRLERRVAPVAFASSAIYGYTQRFDLFLLAAVAGVAITAVAVHLRRALA